MDLASAIEFSMTLGNRLATVPEGYPLPGDMVVIVNAGQHAWSQQHDGTIGYIEGLISRADDEYLVCFNASRPFVDDECCSCSGGPAFYIAGAELKATGRTETRWAWRWIDWPRKDGGRDYQRDCRVYELDLTRHIEAAKTE